MTEKDLKQEIRKLKKLKKGCRAGSEERLGLHRQILELKKELESLNIVDEDKTILIIEIKALDPLMDILDINLNKFTAKELTFHLNKLKARKK